MRIRQQGMEKNTIEHGWSTHTIPLWHLADMIRRGFYQDGVHTASLCHVGASKNKVHWKT